MGDVNSFKRGVTMSEKEIPLMFSTRPDRDYSAQKNSIMCSSRQWDSTGKTVFCDFDKASGSNELTIRNPVQTLESAIQPNWLPESDKRKFSNVTATWHSAGKNVEPSSGNVFGGWGKLTVPNNYTETLPIINAEDLLKDTDLQRNLGIEIFTVPEESVGKINIPIERPKEGKSVVLSSLGLDHRYMSKYVHNSKGQGTVFIEYHDFPHVAMPITSNSILRMVIGQSATPVNEGGKENSETKYRFIEIFIPFGYGIIVGNNVLHSDSASTGQLYITVEPENKDANSVKLRKENGEAVAWNDPTPNAARLFLKTLRDRLAKKKTQQLTQQLQDFNKLEKKKFAGKNKCKAGVEKFPEICGLTANRDCKEEKICFDEHSME